MTHHPLFRFAFLGALLMVLTACDVASSQITRGNCHG
jgi:hypothetical protein